MKDSIAFIAYILVGIFTYSFGQETAEPCAKGGSMCEVDTIVGSVISGAFWPIYWTGAGMRGLIHKARENVSVTSSRNRPYKVCGIVNSEGGVALVIVPDDTSGYKACPEELQK